LGELIQEFGEEEVFVRVGIGILRNKDRLNWSKSFRKPKILGALQVFVFFNVRVFYSQISSIFSGQISSVFGSQSQFYKVKFKFQAFLAAKFNFIR
jgi:hypothetical protein